MRWQRNPPERERESGLWLTVSAKPAPFGFQRSLNVTTSPVLALVRTGWSNPLPHASTQQRCLHGLGHHGGTRQGNRHARSERQQPTPPRPPSAPCRRFVQTVEQIPLPPFIIQCNQGVDILTDLAKFDYQLAVDHLVLLELLACEVPHGLRLNDQVVCPALLKVFPGGLFLRQRQSVRSNLIQLPNCSNAFCASCSNPFWPRHGSQNMTQGEALYIAGRRLVTSPSTTTLGNQFSAKSTVRSCIAGQFGIGKYAQEDGQPAQPRRQRSISYANANRQPMHGGVLVERVEKRCRRSRIKAEEPTPSVRTPMASNVRIHAANCRFFRCGLPPHRPRRHLTAL